MIFAFKNAAKLPCGTVSKLLAAALLSATFAFGATAPANAQDVAGKIRFVIYCAHLLISDPARHLIECGVGDISGGPIHHITHNNPPRKDTCECECSHEETKISFIIDECCYVGD